MSASVGTSRTQPANRPLRFRSTLRVFALLMSAASPVLAQASAEPRTWEVRVTTGSLVPTGGQRQALAEAPFTAIQASWLLSPSVAITGTVGWARSRDIASSGTPRLDVFTSDLGVEVRTSPWFANAAVSFDPFVGMGAGARSYHYRSLDEAAKHNPAGYAAVGGEVGFKRVGLRLEARNYLTSFRPLSGSGESVARNDVVFTAALRLNRVRTAR